MADQDATAWGWKLLGEVGRAEQMAGLHSQAQCVRLTISGKTAFLKVHKTVRSFRQELGFFQQFAASLGECVPSLLGQEENLRALLLSQVPGTHLPTQNFSFEVYRSAGQFLRRLHTLPLVDTDIPLRSALEKRLMAFAERTKGSLSLEAVERVLTPLQELLGEVPCLRRVVCHRDFAEHNWLWDGSRIQVIDFEHSKNDFWLLDLCRLHSLTLCCEPRAEKLFWAGYGQALGSLERHFLHHWSILWAHETRIWGSKHNDHDCRSWGETALKNLA